MAQESVAQETLSSTQGNEQKHGESMLGPLLCWAVVFADIGTSVYYVPGILYNTAGIGNLAGFFVFLTMSVFVLLTLKYAEVTHRFPQGGGVVTVAAQAMNHWVGALGGMFILVDYFLTAAISCLSGMQYLSVVIPILGTMVAVPLVGPLQLPQLLLTIVMLILLGILNWVGISESAKVSLVGAVIAFISDLAILFTVFTHISLGEFFALIPKMFAHHVITPATILVGFAGSFLAFSGLESISQLSPVMKHPHKKVAGMALLLVVLTIGITSPLLTMLSTILQPKAADDPVLNAQLVSLLAGHWGNIFLQTEVAISASALLVFASNTAIIGAYHVFMALSRMEFLPSFVLQRNKLRGTPHYSILLATGIPIVILIAVVGNINILGDMYAFGLLGAFSLTCLGLDIVRYRDWKTARAEAKRMAMRPKDVSPQQDAETSNNGQVTGNNGSNALDASIVAASLLNETLPTKPMTTRQVTRAAKTAIQETHSLWFKIEFWLGVLTTVLVIIAWSTNLVTKPLATAFGGGVASLGMLIAYINYIQHERKGRVSVPVVITHIERSIPDSILAILTAHNGHNDAVIRAAVNNANEHTPLLFLYVSGQKARQVAPRMMEIIDPYLDDPSAKEYFGRAEGMALKAKIPLRQYIYLQEEPDVVSNAWHVIRPHDTIITAGEEEDINDINPDRIRYELTQDGKVAHLLKTW